MKTKKAHKIVEKIFKSLIYNEKISIQHYINYTSKSKSIISYVYNDYFNDIVKDNKKHVLWLENFVLKGNQLYCDLPVPSYSINIQTDLEILRILVENDNFLLKQYEYFFETIDLIKGTIPEKLVTLKKILKSIIINKRQHLKRLNHLYSISEPIINSIIEKTEKNKKYYEEIPENNTCT
jgi:hypothetical protein